MLIVPNLTRGLMSKEVKMSIKMGPKLRETPNELTVATLRKSERGEDVHHAKNAADLFKQLGV